MAEKYGTIPPKWTKAWWEYFWYYYKWRVIVTAAAVLMAAVTIVQCATRTEYDMYITYAGHKNYSDPQTERMEQLITANSADADGDGKTAVLFRQLMFSDTAGSEEYDYAIQTKLDLSMSDECSFIYLFDEAQAQHQLSKTAVSDLFVPADEWAPGTDAKTLTASDGTAYAVSLADSALLKDNEIYREDLYIMVKHNYKEDEENTIAFDSSINIAGMLVK